MTYPKACRLALLIAGLLLIPACRLFQPDPSFPAAPDSPTRAVQSSPSTNPLPTQGTRPTATPHPTIAPIDTLAPEAARGVLARRYLEEITQGIGARLPGSAEEIQTAAYIQSVLEAMGYDVQRQPFSFTSDDGEDLASQNIIAVKAGASPQEIIIGAHYDSTDDASGADDNASGVAVLLEAASIASQTETNYTIRFVAFGAEESGLNGSDYYVSRLSKADKKNTRYMINLDSLIAGDINYVYGDSGFPGSLRDWIIADAQSSDIALKSKTAEDLDDPDGTPCDCADYDAFQEEGILFAYFEATNWNRGDKDGMTQVDVKLGDDGAIRHTPYDTIEYIDKTFPGRIDQNLSVYVTLLEHVMTRFTAE